MSVTVFVKAGTDGERLAACPLGHAVHMAVLALRDRAAVSSIRVLPVCVSRPPVEFCKLGLKRVPAAAITQDSAAEATALDDPEEILQTFCTSFPSGGLQHSWPEADLATADIFSSFCKYMRSSNDTAAGPAAVSRLLKDLHRLNSFLTDLPGPFLCGQQLSRLDCEMMPKLHHLRVACSLVRGLQISATLTGFWRYLHQAYSLDCFVSSCPCNQEIVLHWTDRPGFNKLSFERHKALTREKPKYLFYVPARAVPCLLVE